jgi:hypothetical protein
MLWLASAMKLDSNLAWQDAQAAIRANREVLLALAGVFFLIPTLAFALLYPQPQVPSAMTPQQAFTLLESFYREAFPFMLIVVALQVVGAMTVMTLFTDRTRPTVGGAIRHGAVDTAVFLGGMLVFWVVSGLALGVVVSLAALAGVVVLAGVVTAASIGALLYCTLRMAMVMPVIAVDGERNPLLALRRSWELTRGNAGRIFVVLLLLFVVYFVIVLALTAVAGTGIALTLGSKASGIVMAVLSSAVGALFTLYVIAVLAMIHRQLSGGSPRVIGATFD